LQLVFFLIWQKVATGKSMLSVITITYRDPKGLAATIESLRSLVNSKLSWEHIIVDSSPEENEEIISSVPANWPVRREVRPAKGIYSAMNEGVSLAAGDFIWLLNGGDRLKDLSLLEKMVGELMRDSTLDLIWAGVDLYRQGNFLYPRLPRASLKENIIGTNHLCQQAVIYRKAKFLKVGFFDLSYKIASDYEHFVRCYCLGLNGKRISGILVRYDMDGASSNVKNALQDLARVRRKAFARLPLSFQLENFIKSQIEALRVLTVKRIAASKIGPLLRSTWVKFHRNRVR
jgi:glycosyltransferase involved in cell wall biosynthesis